MQGVQELQELQELQNERLSGFRQGENSVRAIGAGRHYDLRTRNAERGTLNGEP
jgi:hypothetical protein